jgi:hypothetical protein
MRIFITDKAMDISSLATTLGRGGRMSAATLERVKALNPQLGEARKIAAGTAVILPDLPELKPDAGEAAGASSIAEVSAHAKSGFRLATERITERAAQLAADQAAVKDVLKTAAAKRLLESDPVLRKQLAAAEAELKAEQKRVAEAQAQLAAADALAQTEFAKLLKLLG